MESILIWLSQNSEHAPLIIFSLLVIAGFSLPISEDLLLLTSGMLASTVIPEKTLALFLAVFFGSLASDVIAYALGRSFGDKIYGKKWFSLAGRRRIDKLKAFYKKHGVWTLVLGRCIPFGVRNGIFMIAGVAKMRFATFLLSDTIACFVFSATLFFLAYSFASHFDLVCDYVYQGSLVLGVVTALVVAIIVYKRRQKALKAS